MPLGQLNDGPIDNGLGIAHKRKLLNQKIEKLNLGDLKSTQINVLISNRRPNMLSDGLNKQSSLKLL